MKEKAKWHKSARVIEGSSYALTGKVILSWDNVLYDKETYDRN